MGLGKKLEMGVVAHTGIKIPTLSRQRQVDHCDFKASQVYRETLYQMTKPGPLCPVTTMTDTGNPH